MKLQYSQELAEVFSACVVSCGTRGDTECMQKCFLELTRKLVNVCKKDWDVAWK